MNPFHKNLVENYTGKKFRLLTDIVATNNLCEECLQEETKEYHRTPHEAEAVADAQNTEKFTPYSIHKQGTNEFIPLLEKQKVKYVDFTPVVGIERDSSGNPTENHKKNIGRISEILDSYKWDTEKIDTLKSIRKSKENHIMVGSGNKWAVQGKADTITGKRKTLKKFKTENEARAHLYGAGILSLGTLDGEQLTSIPHLQKPQSISSPNSKNNEDHNNDWDAHIKTGFDNARNLFTSDRAAFRKLATEGRKLLGGTEIWSTSSKLAKTTEKDPDLENQGIYMPPANTGGVAKRSACENCTRGCKNSCLSQSGYGGFASTQIARLRRAQMLHMAPAHFAAVMMSEMVGHHDKAQKKGAVVAFRPNATTDHPFHEWWPEAFHKDHTEQNHRGVSVIKMPELKNSVAYAYSAVGKIIKNFANSTFSFKENNIPGGVKHIMGHSINNAWMPMATQDEADLPHAVVFKTTREDGSDQHTIVPAINGNDRDDRFNDHWKSQSVPHTSLLRSKLKGNKFFTVAPGTVAVGTTKLPKDPVKAARVMEIGKTTKFLRDPSITIPDEMRERLPKSLRGLNIHYVDASTKKGEISLPQYSTNISEELKPLLRETFNKLRKRLNKIIYY